MSVLNEQLFQKNPLYRYARGGMQFPPYDTIKNEHMKPAVEELIAEYSTEIDRLVEIEGVTWENFMRVIEEFDDRFKALGIISDLEGRHKSDELTEIKTACSQMSSKFMMRVIQDRRYFEKLIELQAKETDLLKLKVIEDEIKSCKRAGCGLDQEKKERLTAIGQQLIKLSNQFEKNVVESTKEAGFLIEFDSTVVPDELRGLPDNRLEQMREAAKAKGLVGYWVGFGANTFLDVQKFAEDRGLRERTSKAFLSRGSSAKPYFEGSLHDNLPLLVEILNLRQEKAKILGYDTFAEFIMAHERQAESVEAVQEFIDLALERALKKAKREREVLTELGREITGDPRFQMQRWDLWYLQERLRERELNLKTEEVRKYFPVDKVLRGVFDTAERIFGVEAEELTGEDRPPVDDKSVRVLALKKGKKIIGYCYCDLYCREDKNPGAWQGGIKSRRISEDGTIQLPVDVLAANFDQGSTLTHSQVKTFCHEFGHLLNSLMTEIPLPSLGGTSYCRDMVECPSQFFERIVYEKLFLDKLSSEPLPPEVLEGIIKSDTIDSGVFLCRQLYYSLLDLALHNMTGEITAEKVNQVLRETYEKCQSFLPQTGYDEFQLGNFGHLLGYAATYYGYQLSKAYSLAVMAHLMGSSSPEEFRRRGMAIGEGVFAQGGSCPMPELVKNVIGHEVSLEAFFDSYGMGKEAVQWPAEKPSVTPVKRPT